LVRDAGIRQFLDIGTGIPTENNVHQVAQAEAPDARVVYVDKDPIVLAHAHRLLRSTPQGATSYIDGNLAEPGPILDAARQTLDFSEPVAVMLFGILHFFSDADDPRSLLDQFMTPLAPGSYLAISHLASDVHSEELDETFRRLTEAMRESVILRSHDEVVSLFGGLDLVEPGVVQITRWRPEPGSSAPPESMAWSGLARKAS
ncbi:MAG: SAM-dependent methyltransferase, partial [Streptosporangiaceae bacterium]